MTIEPQDNKARLRRLRLGLSVAVILFGVVMMVATLTPFGPSPMIGLVFGGGLVVYGAIRTYRSLRH